MVYKYPICDVFHWFCKIARFFATEPDFKHLTEKYFEIGMKLNDFSIQLVKYCTTIKKEEKEQKRNEEVRENTDKVNQARSIDELKFSHHSLFWLHYMHSVLLSRTILCIFVLLCF